MVMLFYQMLLISIDQEFMFIVYSSKILFIFLWLLLGIC